MRVAVFVSSLLGCAMAFPNPMVKRADDDMPCLTGDDAKELVEAYVRLVSAFDEEDAEKYLAETFTDTSDSINVLAGKELGSVTFPSKEIFTEAQLAQQQHAAPVVVEEVPIMGCDSLAMIWTATFGEAMKSARGMSIVKASKETGAWQFTSFDVEFNTIVWMENMGPRPAPEDSE